MTASVSGALVGSNATAYAASKAGIIGMVRSLVLNYAKFGVRVNAICPGSVLTDMSQQVRDDAELRARFVAGVPAGRIAEASDVASVACFLASDAASYLNGVIIPVEGGLIIH